MKKLTALFAALLIGVGVVMADDVKPVTVNRMPAKAQQTLKSNWPTMAVMSATRRQVGKLVDYKVLMEDGAVLRFDSRGQWLQVKCYTGVPNTMVPAGIRNHIRIHYEGQFVVDITKGKKAYTVQLDQGARLVYDLKGNFLRFL
ncbi:MAG: PepSY-like domain-containing protein [Bacteroidales bacterium]|nr:PepSY-like domain-containing protein [Bacteroidales bacterium]